MITFQEIMKKYIIRIPDYQRGYSWSEENVKDLWQDINNISGYYHYMGNLTFQKIIKPDELNKFKIEFENHDFKFNQSKMTINNKSHDIRFIVDGQQRLTTLIILMQVISERLYQLNLNADTIKSTFLNSFIDDKIIINRLGYIANIPCYNWFKKEILKQEGFQESEASTFYTKQLNDAKKFLADKISKLNNLDIENILYNINQLLFNLVELPDNLNVSLVFETMNNRGRGLTVLEKLKNRLIFLTVEKKLKYNNISLQDHIVDKFSIIYQNLGKNTKRILPDDEFLKAHWLCYFDHSNTKKDKFKEMSKDLFEDRYNMINSDVDGNKIYNYCTSLAELSNYWEKLMNNSFNDEWDIQIKLWNDKLQRMPNNIGEFARPLLLASMSRFYDETNIYKLIEIFKNIERHHFIVYLFDHRKNNMNREDLFRLAYPMYRNQNQLAANINSEINKLIIQSNAGIKFFMNEIENYSNKYYDWLGIKYFLYEYEIELGGGGIDLNKTEVYPIYVNGRQNWGNQFITQINNTNKITKNTKQLFEDMIGNLVLSTKNILLDNYESPIYNNFKNRVSFQLQNNRKIGLTHGLFNEVKVSKDFDSWSPQKIRQRGFELISFLSKRWSIKLDENEINKLVFFGLKNPDLYE